MNDELKDAFGNPETQETRDRRRDAFDRLDEPDAQNFVDILHRIRDRNAQWANEECKLDFEDANAALRMMDKYWEANYDGTGNTCRCGLYDFEGPKP